MRSRPFILATLVCALCTTTAISQGTAPRTTAANYQTQAELEGTELGATLLTANEVASALDAEVNRCCLVVEVGLYPTQGTAHFISVDDFVLRVVQSDIGAKPALPALVAAKLHKTAPTKRGVTVTPTVGVGHESGHPHDSYGLPTRGRGRGVYTSSTVEVEIGRKRPTVTEKDREDIELMLTEKEIPEGPATTPMAGYLYFDLSGNKPSDSYELEVTLNGHKTTLKFTATPQKKEKED